MKVWLLNDLELFLRSLSHFRVYQMPTFVVSLFVLIQPEFRFFQASEKYAHCHWRQKMNPHLF